MKTYKLNANVDNDYLLDIQSKLKKLIKKKIKGKLTFEELDELKKLNKELTNIIESTKQSISTILKNPLGEKVWAGQDNIVFSYRKNWVVKILSEKKYNNSLLLYYQKKYKLLKKYLSEYIPDTYFFWWWNSKSRAFWL